MQTMMAGFERLILEGGIIIWVLLIIAALQIGLALSSILILKFGEFEKLDSSEIDNSKIDNSKIDNSATKTLDKASLKTHNSNKLMALSRYEFMQRLEIRIYRGLPTMKGLVAICPLMGLMGTVTGMMQIFDLVGSGLGVSPRLLSSGISHATLPTMVGMAISVIGLILLNIWQRNIKEKIEILTK